MIRLTSRVVRRTAVWLFLGAALCLLAVMVVVPRVGGATNYAVMTGSMEPGLPPGTLVSVRPVDFDSIDAGEVVTYQLKSGDQAVVTHRVIGRSVDADGRPALITQGDANNAPDPEVVIAEQVKGELWYSVPQLGHLHVAAVEERDLARVVIAYLLLAYAATSIVVGVRRRRRPVAEEVVA